MKRAGFIFISLIFLQLAPFVYAGNASVQVNSEINANSSSRSTYSNDAHIKVDINQEGEGTSQVTVNGETWKQEGPGEIHVDKVTNSNSSPNPNPDSSPNSSPSTDPSPTVDPSASPDPTPSASPKHNDEGFVSAISEFFENIKEFFANLF